MTADNEITFQSTLPLTPTNKSEEDGDRRLEKLEQ